MTDSKTYYIDGLDIQFSALLDPAPSFADKDNKEYYLCFVPFDKTTGMRVNEKGIAKAKSRCKPQFIPHDCSDKDEYEDFKELAEVLEVIKTCGLPFGKFLNEIYCSVCLKEYEVTVPKNAQKIVGSETVKTLSLVSITLDVKALKREIAEHV
jgi:hypothetical protein